MKKLLRPLLPALALFAAACSSPTRTVVLLSTNDIHAQIQRMPRLAAAVAACRDTAEVVFLVDAGDRWTGNAFVDKAPVHGLPVIRLMNRLGYDVATVGNHEFDWGQAHLGRMAERMDFELVCANLVSDTSTFRQPAAATVVERGGVRVGFVGVVTNYEGGHPAGHAESFHGLQFPDPQQAALDNTALRPQVDVLVLVSHMGDDRDAELLATGQARAYDVVIGGHTHVVCDTLIHGTLLTQTGKNLNNVGVTTLRMAGRRVVSKEFRLVALDDYAPDAAMQALVDEAFAEPTLNAPAGHFACTADKVGLAKWIAGSIARRIGADLGIYHWGGVRLDSIAGGAVRMADVYNLEPFSTKVAEVHMTTADLRRMVMAKYNDTENRKESHRIDLLATVPYEIVTDAAGEAADVHFPTLRDGVVYTVAINDYIFKNYKGLDRSAGRICDMPVTEALFESLRGAAVVPDNRLLQTVAAQ